MLRVDFYVVAAASGDALARVACRVIEKAWLGGHDVFVHTDSVLEADQFDALLWTFRQDSFVPHGRYENADKTDYPVRIGCGSEPSDASDVLINLGDSVPLFFARFSRIAEFVGNTDSAREQARARYRTYRSRGCELETHDV